MFGQRSRNSPRQERRLAVRALLALTTIGLIVGFVLIPSPARLAHSQTTETPPVAQQWSMGFWNSLGNPPAPVSSLDMAGLTHIGHFAALVSPDGTLDISYHHIQADGPALIEAAHAAGVKVLLGIVNPYWLGARLNMPLAVANNRPLLIENIMSVVDTLGYDGVNIDWEGAPVDVWNLAWDLRARLGTKLLTADAAYTDAKYWGTVHTLFDRVNIMTYDMTGTWNPYSWHNAALYDFGGIVWSVDRAVKRFVAAGIPPEKLNIGIPFYGWLWTGGVTGPNQFMTLVTPTLKQLNYNVLAPQITPQHYNWDDFAQVPYLSFNTGTVSTNQFLTYDNERSIAQKISYTKANGLGGWIIWNLQGDYFPSNAEKHPLLKAVKDAMGVVTAPPAEDQENQPPQEVQQPQ